jgi:hypothetical protein
MAPSGPLPKVPRLAHFGEYEALIGGNRIGLCPNRRKATRLGVWPW